MNVDTKYRHISRCENLAACQCTESICLPTYSDTRFECKNGRLFNQPMPESPTALRMKTSDIWVTMLVGMLGLLLLISVFGFDPFCFV